MTDEARGEPCFERLWWDVSLVQPVTDLPAAWDVIPHDEMTRWERRRERAELTVRNHRRRRRR